MDLPLIHKGYFTGDIDDNKIAIGYYSIRTDIDFVHDSFLYNFSPWYGLFIQFESFTTQLIISGGSGQIGFRRRAGDPPQWGGWILIYNH